MNFKPPPPQSVLLEKKGKEIEVIIQNTNQLVVQKMICSCGLVKYKVIYLNI